jgi:single-strand DNA-binding protein
MGINKVILVGNLGTDVELRALPSGTHMAKFRMATTDNRNKDENGNPRTEWHSIVVWGRMAEICDQYLRKGRQVYVEGSIHTYNYEKDGQKKYFTEIHARTVEFLGGRDSGGGGYGGGGYAGPSDSYGGPPSGGHNGGGGGYGGPPPDSSPKPDVDNGPPSGPSFPDDGDDVPF